MTATPSTSLSVEDQARLIVLFDMLNSLSEQAAEIHDEFRVLLTGQPTEARLDVKLVGDLVPGDVVVSVINGCEASRSLVVEAATEPLGRPLLASGRRLEAPADHAVWIEEHD